MGFRNRRYVIVGDGAAGITAARTLREGDAAAEIALVSDDPNPAYFRAALTNYLLGELREEQIWATRPDFYERYQLRRHRARCSALDTRHRRVVMSTGEAVEYDALLLACGARARRPNFTGHELDGVLTLRTLQDCRATMERIASGQVSHAVVLGGGPLALEWALGMHAQGIQITVILRGNVFMAGSLDGVASDLLAARLRDAGLKLLFSDEITAALAGPNGSLARVTTRSGHTLDCQLVAAGIGIVPNTEWLTNSEVMLTQRGAIAVGTQMQTSVDAVYAAGDVAEFEGRMLGLWEPAQAQARVAASNMRGTPAHYAPGVHYMATRLFDLDFASLGDVQGSATAKPIVDLPKGTGRLNYRKLVVDQGQLVGALMFGHREDKVRRRGRWFKRIMDAGVDVSSVANQLLDDDFDVGAWFEGVADGQRAALAAIPTFDSTARPQQPEVASGASLRGTQFLGLASATAVPSSAPTSQAAQASAGATNLMPGAFVSQSRPSDAAPANLAATHALGTQMLTHFNPRPVPAASTAATSGRLAFVLVNGERRALEGDLCRIGRDASSEIHLLDPMVSITHAHLQRQGDAWYLRDLGSTSGTWVNGKSDAAPRRLVSGDRLRVGQTELVFFYEGDEQTALRSSMPHSIEAEHIPHLEVRSGHSVGLRFPLVAPVVIGSDPACGLWLDDPTIAGQHARVDPVGESWQVTGLSSTAGLWVNQRAHRVGEGITLSAGTAIRLGSVALELIFAPPRGSRASAPPRPSQPQSQARGTGQRMQAFAAVNPAKIATTTGQFPRLRVLSGPNAGQTCQVLEYLVIGHQPSCQWVLTDPLVAPQQLELQRFGGTLYARNLGAPGSVGRNGADLGPSNVPIAHGDQLQLGPNTQLVYEESA